LVEIISPNGKRSFWGKISWRSKKQSYEHCSNLLI